MKIVASTASATCASAEFENPVFAFLDSRTPATLLYVGNRIPLSRVTGDRQYRTMTVLGQCSLFGTAYVGYQLAYIASTKTLHLQISVQGDKYLIR